MAFKCSLLTLSCALDGELPTSTQAELESHLVSCERCKIGLQYLREETERIANLPRIHLPGGTIEALLQRTRVVELSLPEEGEGSGPGRVSAAAASASASGPAAEPIAGADELPVAGAPAGDDPSTLSVEVRGRPAGLGSGSLAAEVSRAEGAAAGPAGSGDTLSAPEPEPRIAPAPPPPPSADRRAGARARDDRPLEQRPPTPTPEPEPARVSSERGVPAARDGGGDTAPAPGAAPAPEASAAPAARARRARRPPQRGSDSARGRDASGQRPGLLAGIWPRAAATVAVAVAVVLLGVHLAQPGSRPAALPPSPTPTPGTRAGGVGAPTPGAAKSPSASATPTAASSPTAAARPTAAPGQGALPSLTGATTIGGAAAGYSVQTVRYGLHADGFWIVLQLVGGHGVPRTTVGFSGPTTLDVELQGVRPGIPVPAPQAGMVVTGVTAGGGGTTALYTLHLAHAVQVSPSYLAGSLTGPSGERLILILH
ncbi:MAG TPA: zf-HC2 domain-containing protein [Verrucomicrobiae bacterium]|nr:zf-HC2 domain-containing protein [Verrucomicrobiae bacterium]